MRFVVIIICAGLLVVACNSDKPPSTILDEEAYVDLIVELQLLREYQKQERPDSTSVDSIRQIIFKKYETTEKQFQRSHQFYQQNIKEQKNRIGKAIENLRKDRLAGQDSAASRDSI
jgi:hypothetical protein